MTPERKPHPSRPRIARGSRRRPLALLVGLAVVAGPLLAQGPTDATDVELSAQMGPKQHKKRQKRPVKMGTSAGNVNDFVISGNFITCCSGTAGALLRKGDQHFILSNNHVLAQVNQANLGDSVNQPGMLDTACRTFTDDSIATLSGFRKLKFGGPKNKVDAAIAEVVDGTVDETGEVIGIGVPGDSTVNPKVGMLVQKSGRTTGNRKGMVDLVNVTVDVEYTDSCSDDANVISARFKKTFFIRSTNNKGFSAGGDSGSVIYEDNESCPNAVGLLFGGNEVITVANKMSVVMKEVKKMTPKGKAELVGCNSATSGSKLTSLSGARDLSERDMRRAERIQSRRQEAILAVDGVHAMGIGRSRENPDKPVFRVYVEGDRAAYLGSIPRELDGMPVEVVTSAPIRALNCRTVQTAATTFED